MANPSSQDKGCPLDDPWGRQWRRYTQGKANAETHPELWRKLAGDAWFRYQAHLQHHDTTRALAARFEFESDTKKVGILTDDQKGLNNYAEPSLHLAVKGRSRSKLFRSSLDKTHPAFKEFLSDRQNRKESSAKTDIAKFSDALKNSTAIRTKFSLSRKEEKIAPAKTISKQILPETEAKPTGLSKEVPKVDVPRVQGQNFFGPRFGGPQDKASFRPTFQGATNRVPEVVDRRVANSAPKFGLPGMGPRLPTQAVPRFPQVQRDGPTFKSYNGSSSKCNENANITPVGDPIRAFRTAHDELVIQNNQKRTNEISSNSYGAVKKTLGVPRGGNVAGTFKPPIANKGQTVEPVQGENHSNGLLSNEKLKHLDPKMVELIQNEIMDKGSPIGWDDIAGLDFVKVTVKEIVVFPLLRPDIFKGLRGPPKGLLLFGPPGTGKTLIGKCIACQSNSTFFSISASSLTSKWVGEGEKMVRTLFEVARTFQPAVVFIDEIDSLLSQRSDTEHESSRRIKTEFLVQLDGATSVGDERILVVGATNRPQDLDEAARRRLVKRLYVPLPEQNAREQIIYNLLATQSHSMSAAEISTIAAKAEGYSGADMSNLCKEAAMGPIRSLDYSKIDQIMMEDVRPIKFEDFVDAFKQVRASVSSNDLQQYMEWDAKYGSGK